MIATFRKFSSRTGIDTKSAPTWNPARRPRRRALFYQSGFVLAMRVRPERDPQPALGHSATAGSGGSFRRRLAGWSGRTGGAAGAAANPRAAAWAGARA